MLLFTKGSTGRNIPENNQVAYLQEVGTWMESIWQGGHVFQHAFWHSFEFVDIPYI